MKKFDYQLFHTLFDNVWNFRDAIEEGTPEEVDITDHSGKDISACTRLSIFPQLKNITHWGENVELHDYFELKQGKRIVGAKGVIISGMDWVDVDEPVFYYEFRHVERGTNVDEYIRELHLDDVVTNVFAPLTKPSSGPERGSEPCKEVVCGLISRADPHEFAPESRSQIKYKCIFEGEDVEVWKVGFHNSSYQLFLVAPSFLAGVNTEAFIHHYLRGVQLTEKTGPVKPMPTEQLEKMALQGHDGNWLNIGAIDLDLQLTIRNQEEARVHAELDLAKRVYSLAVNSQFPDIDYTSLPQVVAHYDAPTIATLMTATLGRGKVADQFRDQFSRACKQHCPERLKAAKDLMKQYLG